MKPNQIADKLLIVVTKEYPHEFVPSDPDNDMLSDLEERAYWMGYLDIQGFMRKDLNDLLNEI